MFIIHRNVKEAEPTRVVVGRRGFLTKVTGVGAALLPVLSLSEFADGASQQNKDSFAGQRPYIQQLANILTAPNLILNTGFSDAVRARQIIPSMLGAQGGTVPSGSTPVVTPYVPKPGSTNGLIPFTFPTGNETGYFTDAQSNKLKGLIQSGASPLQLAQELLNIIEWVNLKAAEWFGQQLPNADAAVISALQGAEGANGGSIRYPQPLNSAPPQASLALFCGHLYHSVTGYLSLAQMYRLVPTLGTGHPIGGEPIGCCNGKPNIPKSNCTGTWYQGPC
jgi:hypothetical protein